MAPYRGTLGAEPTTHKARDEGAARGGEADGNAAGMDGDHAYKGADEDAETYEHHVGVGGGTVGIAEHRSCRVDLVAESDDGYFVAGVELGLGQDGNLHIAALDFF